MASRQERRKAEREKLRQERQRQEAQQARQTKTRLMLGYGAAGVLVVAVLVGLVIVITNAAGGGGEAHVSIDSGETHGVPLDERSGTPPPAWESTDLEAAAQQAGCTLELDLPEEGREHIPADTAEEDWPEYASNPPASGDHHPAPQADGAYAEKPEDVYVVHALEHGRIALQYDPSLPEDAQRELRGLYNSMHAGALFFPNADMPHAVAATAWRNRITCDEYRGGETADAIRNFGVATFGRGPEPANAFGPLDGPTPGRPDTSDS